MIRAAMIANMTIAIMLDHFIARHYQIRSSARDMNRPGPELRKSGWTRKTQPRLLYSVLTLRDPTILYPISCAGFDLSQKGKQHVMQSRSIRRPGQAIYPLALSNAGY
jgi:hypothetical protein